jgi:tRNA A-37 threonylcarbamoyl transferase component Bud32
MSSSVVGPGQIIADRYRIERLLGQGGMGSVYQAVQLSVERRVALKLLVDESLDQPQHVTRFEREALALARLADPHTVRLFDFGTDERRRPFIVMEFLHGCDVADDLARHGPMRWDQALQVCRQVLGSLAEAHDAGIIHRDIKPANLFLCVGREWPLIKVLDFGIAGSAEQAGATRKLTLTGTVLGSAAYMSPEQAQGHEAGPAADLYALGVVLFELLTGVTPFEGRTFTAQLLAKVIERAPALSEVRPDIEVPAGVQVLVEELLEKDVAKRPRAARAVVERIASLLEGVSLAPLERPIHAPVPASQFPLLAQTEAMLLPRTFDDGWAPPKTAPVQAARPVARAPRARRAFLAFALLSGAGVLGWQLWPRPHPDEQPSGMAALTAPRSLASSPPSQTGNEGLDGADAVEAQVGALRSSPMGPSKGDEATPADAGLDAEQTMARSGFVHEAPRPAHPEARRRRAPPASVAPAAQGPSSTAAAPGVHEPDPAPATSDSAVSATAQPPDAVTAAPAVTPSGDGHEPAAATPSAGPAGSAPQQYPSVAAARAAEKSGDITPAQRNAIIASLSERRLLARARAARDYRDGRIDRAELKERQREIERDFQGTPP